MKYSKIKSECHVRSAIYRTGDPTKIYTFEDLKLLPALLQPLNIDRVGTIVPKRYYKNHSVSFDDRVPEEDKLFDDWEEYDPRDDDNGSLSSFND